MWNRAKEEVKQAEQKNDEKNIGEKRDGTRIERKI